MIALPISTNALIFTGGALIVLLLLAVIAAIPTGTSADRSIGRDPEAGKKPRDPDRHNH